MLPGAPTTAWGPVSTLLLKNGLRNGKVETYLRLEEVVKVIISILGFGRFLAELGPKTRPNGLGSKHGAERTHN